MWILRQQKAVCGDAVLLDGTPYALLDAQEDVDEL